MGGSDSSSDRSQGTGPAALEGMRVLDMALVGPGPFCATILGDLGADIIKIHEPHPERRGGPLLFKFPDRPEFPGLRNCRSMGLNLKADEGRAIFLQLAKAADVITESFRPGVMKRLGLDYDAVKEVNPRIVYASVTGFGQDGPYRDLVGHDINYISLGGLLGMTGTEDGGPVIPGIPVADFAAGGMAAAISILGALTARERTGRGQYVDVAMTDAVVGLVAEWINPYLYYGELLGRGGTWLTGYRPWYNVYETRDGKYISVGAVEPRFFSNLCELLGCEEYVEHQYAEGEKRKEMIEYFRRTFLTKTRDEWLDILRQKETCVSPVYTIDEVVSDPHVVARGMVAELPHPTMGKARQVGSWLKLSKSPFEVRNWTRRFGQHTDEILQELGYDGAAVHSLRDAEIVG